MHGQGFMAFALDDERANYSGDFNYGQMSGNGLLFWKDGANYSGNFHEGQINGQGTMYFGKNGSNNFKSLIADPMSPNTTLINTNKTGFEFFHEKGSMLLYSGDFKSGKLSGIGAMTWQDVSNYNGQWEEGERQGFGTFTFAPDNQITSIEGLWFQDEVAYIKKWFGKLEVL